MPPQVSVIVPTCDRAKSLQVLLEGLVAQDTTVSFEIIVVDNGSSMGATRAVVEAFRQAGHNIQSLREERRGVSYARNTGAANAGAPILAFCDDDHDVAPSWISSIVRAFDAHQTIDAIGGRELPRWKHPRPAWLTENLFGPVSLADRGDREVRLHRRQWMCLLGGNLAIRRTAFDALNGFDPAYPRTQDRELTVRLLLSGREAMYVPDMVVYHRLEAERLTKRRFRAWSASEGRMRAGYAFEELFTRDGEIRPLPAGMPTVFGVSRFMYRHLGHAVMRYMLALPFPRPERFEREMRLRYLWAYVQRRSSLVRARRRRTSNPFRRAASTAATRVVTLFSDIIG